VSWEALLAVLAATALVADPAWSLSRYPVTIVHEAGHALVASVSGHSGVRVSLHVGSEGLTEWDEADDAGPAAVLAGYPAPAALGLGALAGLHYGSSAWVLWGALAALGLVFLVVRNFFGLLLVAACAAPVYGALRYAPDDLQSWAALVLGWLLLAGAARSAIQDAYQEGSDCDLLADRTGVPASIWYTGFVLSAVAAVGYGAWLTLNWW
jgi:hypothetical protein